MLFRVKKFVIIVATTVTTIAKMQLKIRKIGNSLGASMPKELLEKLMVKEGDTVYVTETPEGILLSPYDPEFAEVLEVSKDISHRYKNALKKLAE